MELNYNVTGNERKALVKVISETTGEKAVYKFTPTYAFEIGEYTVTRYGILEYPGGTDASEVIAALSAAGFVHAPVEETETAEPAEETLQEEPDDEPSYEDTDSVELTVEMPLDKVAVGNLTKLLEAKGGLIKKALGIDSLEFDIRDDRIAFPWFPEVEPAEAQAYTHFIAALCKMAKEATRVTATEKAVDNEKYAFRCFLLRLGFTGNEYKADRKILLKNLSGSSAFKSGARKGGEKE